MTVVNNPTAFLVRQAGRICIQHWKSTAILPHKALYHSLYNPLQSPPEILADKTEFQQQEQDPDNGEYIPIYTWVYKNVYDPYRIAEQMQRDAS